MKLRLLAAGLTIAVLTSTASVLRAQSTPPAVQAPVTPANPAPLDAATLQKKVDELVDGHMKVNGFCCGRQRTTWTGGFTSSLASWMRQLLRTPGAHPVSDHANGATDGRVRRCYSEGNGFFVDSTVPEPVPAASQHQPIPANASQLVRGCKVLRFQ